MLTPSELRDKAKELRFAWSEEERLKQVTSTVLEELQVDMLAVADLYEQVAAIRDALNPIVMVDVGQKLSDYPRILKASEITEPGWYACRAVGQRGWSAMERASRNLNSLKITYSSGCADRASVMFDRLEFYGPIPLPE